MGGGQRSQFPRTNLVFTPNLMPIHPTSCYQTGFGVLKGKSWNGGPDVVFAKKNVLDKTATLLSTF